MVKEYFPWSIGKLRFWERWDHLSIFDEANVMDVNQFPILVEEKTTAKLKDKQKSIANVPD